MKRADLQREGVMDPAVRHEGIVANEMEKERLASRASLDKVTKSLRAANK